MTTTIRKRTAHKFKIQKTNETIKIQNRTFPHKCWKFFPSYISGNIAENIAGITAPPKWKIISKIRRITPTIIIQLSVSVFNFLNIAGIPYQLTQAQLLGPVS